VTLEPANGDRSEPLSQAFRFPAGRPTRRQPAAELGLEATASANPDGRTVVTIASRRLAHGVRIVVPPFPYKDKRTFESSSKDAVILFKTDSREGYHIED